MKIKTFAFPAALFFFALSAWASPITVDQIYAPQGLTIFNNRATLTLPQTALSEQIATQSNAVTLSNKTFDKTSNVKKQARGVYDFAVFGGATGGNFNLSMGLPINAVITNAFIDVVQQPQTGTGATIGISANNAALGADIFANTASSSFIVGELQGKEIFGSTNTYLKLAAATGITVNIRSGSLTTGKFVLYLDYAISE